MVKKLLKNFSKFLAGLVGSWTIYGLAILVLLMTNQITFTGSYSPWEGIVDNSALLLAFAAFVYFLVIKQKYIAYGILAFLVFNEITLVFFMKFMQVIFELLS